MARIKKKYRHIEKEIENSILEYLTLLGFYCWKNQSTGVFDKKKGIYRKTSKFQLNGVSDILVILPNGKLWAIEVKSPTGVLSDDQKIFLNTAKSLNAFTSVCTSIEQVQEEIKLKKIPVPRLRNQPQ